MTQYKLQDEHASTETNEQDESANITIVEFEVRLNVEEIANAPLLDGLV
jgi:hypothetical protein